MYVLSPARGERGGGGVGYIVAVCQGLHGLQLHHPPTDAETQGGPPRAHCRPRPHHPAFAAAQLRKNAEACVQRQGEERHASEPAHTEQR